MDASLDAIARAATGRAVRDATVVARVTLPHDAFLPGRQLALVRGMARTRNAATVPWQAIVKSTSGPGLRAARRELAAYRLGIASPRAARGVRAPALLGSSDDGDAVELWLEPLQDVHGGSWPRATFELAAGRIAAWDAAWVGRQIPDELDGLDEWAAHHGQPGRVGEALEALEAARRETGASEAMTAIDDVGFERTQSMIEGTHGRLRQLATFPASLLHHDLVRTNLFLVRPRTVAAIDWELAGPGPLGADLAPLVVGSVRRGELSSADLPAVERATLRVYAKGLRRAGVDAGLVAAVSDAYRLALGLRWHVVLGVIHVILDPTATRIRGSRRAESRADGLAHLVPLARHLLASSGPRSRS